MKCTNLKYHLQSLDLYNPNSYQDMNSTVTQKFPHAHFQTIFHPNSHL